MGALLLGVIRARDGQRSPRSPKVPRASILGTLPEPGELDREGEGWAQGLGQSLCSLEDSCGEKEGLPAQRPPGPVLRAVWLVSSAASPKVHIYSCSMLC